MAIAFDAAVGPTTVNPNTTVSHSHTCTGSNLMLFVFILSATDDVTSATYNGVGMTFVAKLAETFDSRYLHLYALANPATGANTLTVTTTSSELIRIESVSYSGVSQTTTMDNSTTGNTIDSADQTVSLTPVADNCWMMVATRGGFANVTAGTGSTLRTSANFNGIFDNNAAITPAASTSMTQGQGDASADWGYIAVTFAPAATTSIIGPFPTHFN